MDQSVLFESLVAWVNTFELADANKPKCENANDFKDGIIIAKCLNNIDPVYFNEEWANKIKAETNDNWCLKLLNLKKILQTITDYYSEVLNHSLSGFEMPKLNLIADANDTSESIIELNHLLQLVLGCAVNCERKSEFIQVIMEMNETTQLMIMNAIQDLMSKDRSASFSKASSSTGNSEDDLSFQLKKAFSDIARLNEQKDEFELKCKKLDKQIATLQDEKLNLLHEIESIKEKLMSQDNHRVDSNNEINKQLKLQQKLDQMQEELYKLESEKEKFRIQLEAAKFEQNLLIEKNIELKKIAQDAQTLKDEIDVLKHNSDKVEKLESAIEMYKIKLEEMVDLRKQLKQLEENNANYLEQIVQMEKEVKKIGTFKSQIEMYKKQIQELHEQVLNGEMKMKTLEYEYKGVEETCTNLKQDKMRIQNEYDKLKEVYEELQVSSQVQNASEMNATTDADENSANSAASGNQTLDGLFSSVELFNIPAETKEKIIRLFHENKILKSKQNDMNDERLALIQTQYEDERQRSVDLQTKLNETSKQKIELECQLNDLRKKEKENSNTLNSMEQQVNQSKAKDDQITEYKIRLSHLQTQFEEESKKHEQTNKQHIAKIALLNLENERLVEIATKDKDDLASKEKEIQELNTLNEKYRAYLEKAKYVIQNINSPDSNMEVHQLRQQLADKDKSIKHLMKEIEKIQSDRELEVRLVASSWYQLGADLNRHATDERINSMGSSFLAQQRHLSTSGSNAVPNTATTKMNANGGNRNNQSLNNSNGLPSPIYSNVDARLNL